MSTLREILAELRGYYLASLGERGEELLALSEAARRDPAARVLAAAHAHRLHGSAGSYEFAAVSEAAGQLERLLESDDPAALADPAFDDALAALRASLACAVEGAAH